MGEGLWEKHNKTKQNPGSHSGRSRAGGLVSTLRGVARERFPGEVTFVGRSKSQKEADEVVLRSGVWVCVGGGGFG